MRPNLSENVILSLLLFAVRLSKVDLRIESVIFVFRERRTFVEVDKSAVTRCSANVVLRPNSLCFFGFMVLLARHAAGGQTKIRSADDCRQLKMFTADSNTT